MLLPIDKIRRFKLSQAFTNSYAEKEVKWGYNGLGYATYKRTYSRDGEEWFETVKRVVEGVYNIQKAHCFQLALPWDNRKAQRSAQIMYDLIFNFKFLPSGRGLYNMGAEFLWERGAAPLFNCAFVSTGDITPQNFSDPFCWTMSMLAHGVGVGSDVDGAGNLKILAPLETDEVFVVPDSREGWVQALRIVLDAFAKGNELPKFDYSEIRKKGEPLKTFGGTASGPEPLIYLIDSIIELYNKNIGNSISETMIVDTMNMIGRCIVSGGIRRSAEILLGPADSDEFLSLKNPNLYPDEVNGWRWASNNSVRANVGMDYSKVAKMTALNGEPGYIWFENIGKFGRLIDPENPNDMAVGINPCGEIPLESYELCNLVETFPAFHDSPEEYMRTLKYAYLYAKSVTLLPTHSDRTNAVQMKNRRIGLSQSGIQQSINKHGFNEHFMEFCDRGYNYIQELDRIYSDWLCIPRSKRTTTVKPSGSISLLCGATPGIHYAQDEYYIRRLRVSDRSPLVDAFRDAGYVVEKAAVEANTMVIEFPIKEENFFKSKRDVSIWEQVVCVVRAQEYWSDNSVSCTVHFMRDEREQIESALRAFDSKLKSISFLPFLDDDYKLLDELMRICVGFADNPPEMDGIIEMLKEKFGYLYEEFDVLYDAQSREELSDLFNEIAINVDKRRFKQLPYQSITKAEYEEMSSRLRPLNLSEAKHEVTEKFCDGDSCTI